MTNEAEHARWRLLLIAIADDLWPLTVIRAEDGNFQLAVCCNDIFSPAADIERVPMGEEAAVIALAPRTGAAAAGRCGTGVGR